jgi:hypothetical protein
MKESAIEKYLVAQAKARGAFVRKVTYQGRKGAPDRWLFYPRGFLLIVELKRPGEKPEPLQLNEMQKLRNAGFYVAWADSREKVDAILDHAEMYALHLFNERHPL